MALSFEINLGGNFVDALEKSKHGLEETSKGAHGAEKALELFEGELGKVRAGALGLNFNAFQEGGHFLTFDLAEGAAIAFEAVKKVVEVIADLGKEMITTAGKAEDLNLAIKLDVGEEGAEKVNKLAESFAGTRFDDRLIKESLLPILEESGDEHNEQWDDLVTAATDVATRRNTGSAGAKSALDALRSIEIQPQKMKGALKELGIKSKDFYSDLGDLLGVSAATAEKQTKAGKIKAQTLLSVALNQIAEREGGALGNATNEGSKTLGSTLERLGNLKENLFEGLAGSPGMRAIQGVLDNFVQIMGEEAPSILAEVSAGFADIFGDFTGPDGAEKIRGVIHAVVDKFKELIHDFRDAWPEIKSGLGDTVEVLKVLGETVKGIVGLIKDAISLANTMNGKSQIEEYVKAHPEGDLLGRQQWWKDLVGSEETKGRARGLAEVRPGSLDIPKFASGGIVDGPTLALVGEAGPEAIVPLGRGPNVFDGADANQGATSSLGRGLSFQFGDVIIHGGGGDAASNDDLAQRIRAEQQKMIDEAAVAFGVD